MKLQGFDDVRVGDFVGIYDGKLFINTSLVIGKNPKNRKIQVDDVFAAATKRFVRERRIKWVTECELVDELSQRTIYDYFINIPKSVLPEKTWYLRLIKLNRVFKKLKENEQI